MDIFFYGLFMDHSILKKNGIEPSNPRMGYLKHYTLRIGNRASLIPCNGEKSYGIVMTANSDAIRSLYAEASVADYIPEEVTIITDTNEEINATCYNLPEELLTGTNESYAASLYKLAKQQNFPNEYLEKIQEMAH